MQMVRYASTVGSRENQSVTRDRRPFFIAFSGLGWTFSVYRFDRHLVSQHQAWSLFIVIVAPGLNDGSSVGQRFHTAGRKRSFRSVPVRSTSSTPIGRRTSGEGRHSVVTNSGSLMEINAKNPGTAILSEKDQK
jgi:hypothetical protein